LAVAADADFRNFPRTPPLTRESTDVLHISRGRVHADQVRLLLPWLYELYRGPFLELANEAWTERVSVASDERYGVVLNVQHGKETRSEAHVDSNPLSGLLCFTDHPAGGGERAISRDPAVSGIAAIDRDCLIIRPQAGYLVFFDGRERAHYARQLNNDSDLRVLAVMNFYTESHPETQRPRVLNHHPYGDPL
jgi:hypothetical protein